MTGLGEYTTEELEAELELRKEELNYLTNKGERQ